MGTNRRAYRRTLFVAYRLACREGHGTAGRTLHRTLEIAGCNPRALTSAHAYELAWALGQIMAANPHGNMRDHLEALAAEFANTPRYALAA